MRLDMQHQVSVYAACIVKAVIRDVDISSKKHCAVSASFTQAKVSDKMSFLCCCSKGWFVGTRALKNDALPGQSTVYEFCICQANFIQRSSQIMR